MNQLASNAPESRCDTPIFSEITAYDTFQFHLDKGIEDNKDAGGSDPTKSCPDALAIFVEATLK